MIADWTQKVNGVVFLRDHLERKVADVQDFILFIVEGVFMDCLNVCEKQAVKKGRELSLKFQTLEANE